MGRSRLALFFVLAIAVAGCELPPVAQGDATGTRSVDDEATRAAVVATATPTLEPAATPTLEAPATLEATPTSEPTLAPEPTATPTPAAAPEPTPTPTPAATPTPTPKPTATPWPTPTPLPAQESNALNTGALSITEIIFARTSPIAEGSLLITSGPDGRNQSVFRGFDGTIFNPKWSVEANFVVAFETDVEDIIGFVVMDHTGRIISRQQGWNCELKIEECNLHALWPRHFEKNVYIASRGKLYEHVVETGKPTAGYLEPFDQLPSTGEIMGIDLIGDSNDYALATDMDGNWDIWRGLGFDKVTKTDSYEETYPRWSPDGKFIAFTTTRLGNKDIFLINLETGSFRQITNSQADDIQPTWSPDGTHIAFASNRNGNWDIFVASAEVGGEDKFLFQLTSSPEDDLHPDWRNYR